MLGGYRVLSSNGGGVHVSPTSLGAMSIGGRWASIEMGSMDKFNGIHGMSGIPVEIFESILDFLHVLDDRD